MAYLNALVGREPGGLLEVRWRHEDGMRRGVYRAADELPAAVRAILELGASTDVYVGCAPRAERAGGVDAVARAWVLWADCDTAESIAALQAFRPAPAIVVRSGSGENRHAYWTLTGPIDAETATAGNRRLAHALGADSGAVTSAATILRPPGSANFKHTPPTRVRTERIQPWRRVSARALLTELPDPPTRTAGAAKRRAIADTDDDDPLRRVAPAVYVQALTGLMAGRDGKVSCPFHGPDRTPSLHVYEDPAAGWYCYSCQRGGSIYDLGAEVFGLATRGREFIQLRRRLHAVLGAWAPVRRVHSGDTGDGHRADDT
jgi:hypothetical protein